jgi:NDP-sugar pyrophosphorylase family protein
MNAIILAAGKGERMLPFTKTNNKCCFKINNIPLIEYHVINLINSGFNNIFITTFWKKEKIHQILHKYKEIIFHDENILKGSGAAIKEVFEIYKINNALIINGDTFYIKEVYKIIFNECQSNKNYPIVFSKYCTTDEFKTGLIKIDKNLKVLDIYEKIPNKYNSFTNINDIFCKNIGLVYLRKNDINKFKGDLMTNSIPKIKNKIKIIIPKINELFFWKDIGSLENYIELNYFFFMESVYKNIDIELMKRFIISVIKGMM